MRLSIGIVEYHCMEDVLSCIDSLEQYFGEIEYECIIVSNSEYTESVQQEYRDLLSNKARFISTNCNLGYAGGVNAIIKKSSGEFIYILNPDCRVLDDGIVKLMDAMEGDPNWAIAGPMVLDNDNKIQPSCRRFPRPWTFLLVRSVLSRLPGARFERARYLMEDYQKNAARNVDWVSGGAVLLSRKAIEQIGGMDERYFLYMEDVDWCRSAWDCELKVAYWPFTRVVHAGQHKSISAGRRMFFDRHFRWHLMSLMKYFLKYKFRTYPATKVYVANNNKELAAHSG